MVGKAAVPHNKGSVFTSDQARSFDLERLEISMLELLLRMVSKS
jgi:hypothetical protein